MCVIWQDREAEAAQVAALAAAHSEVEAAFQAAVASVAARLAVTSAVSIMAARSVGIITTERFSADRFLAEEELMLAVAAAEHCLPLL